MGRTLYLSENDRYDLKRDGASLLVLRPNRSPQRLPINMISRVFFIGNLKIETASIILFCEHNIPVIFMDFSGKQLGTVIPYNHLLPHRFKEQRILLETTENARRYMRWAEARKQLLQKEVLKRKPASRNKISHFSQLAPADSARWQVVKQTFSQLLRGLIIENLSRAGLDPHYGVFNRGSNWGLVLDLIFIMEPEVDGLSLEFSKFSPHMVGLIKTANGWRLSRRAMRYLVRHFENNREHLSEVINKIIDELIFLIRELRT